MPNEEDIQNQQKLLQIYRRRLAYALAQQAVGGMTAPFNVRDDIRECRTHIYQIKVILRDWGVTAADHPNDSDNADSPQPTLDSKNVEAERFNKLPIFWNNLPPRKILTQQ